MNIDTLKFMVGHTGGSFAPILANVLIHDGRMQAGNGRYTVECPCDLPDVCVHGDKLLAAFQACKDNPTATLGPTGYTVRGGKTRARLPVLDAEGYPRTDPDPETEHTAPGISALLKRIGPFVAEDASRPWATSVCIHGGFAYATNNVVLCRVPFPAGFGRPVNIPSAVIDAITTLGEPVGMGVSELSATFYFEGGVWVKSQLIAGDWPTSTVDGMVATVQSAAAWQQVNPALKVALETAVRICDDRVAVVRFENGGIALMDDSFASEDLEPVPESGKLNARMTALVLTHADEIQWHTPKDNVHAFRQGDLVGVFSGQR